MQHQEDYASSASQDEQYFESYADLSVHKVMLRDRPRMDFYRTVLKTEGLMQGKVVADVGSGTGILSCWAAQAGAAHVLSIEASSMAQLQRRIVEDNDLSDRVTVIASTVEAVVEAGVEAFLAAHPAVREAGGISFVVSEWMGFYLFHECMLPSVLRARDFFTEVNATLGDAVMARMIPARGELRATPVTLQPYYKEMYAPFWTEVDGVRLATLGRLEYEERLEAASPLVDVIPPRSLLHEGGLVWSGDFNALRMEELTEVQATVAFDFSKSAAAAQRLREAGRIIVDGFTLWFRVSYGETVLDTSPLAEPTHWKQTTVLLPREFRDEEVLSFDAVEERLEVQLRLTSHDPAQRYYTIEFELN